MLRTLLYIILCLAAIIIWSHKFKESLKSGVSSLRFYGHMRRCEDPVIIADRKIEPIMFYFFLIWDFCLAIFLCSYLLI